jgi:hypothetical protein
MSLRRGMEEAPENGKESSHSAHANGMNEWMHDMITLLVNMFGLPEIHKLGFILLTHGARMYQLYSLKKTL